MEGVKENEDSAPYFYSAYTGILVPSLPPQNRLTGGFLVEYIYDMEKQN
jgi:hypothetical protein